MATSQVFAKLPPQEENSRNPDATPPTKKCAPPNNAQQPHIFITHRPLPRKVRNFLTRFTSGASSECQDYDGPSSVSGRVSSSPKNNFSKPVRPLFAPEVGCVALFFSREGNHFSLPAIPGRKPVELVLPTYLKTVKPVRETGFLGTLFLNPEKSVQFPTQRVCLGPPKKGRRVFQ